MPSVNQVVLIGHLGRDAVERRTASGKRVVEFSLATTEKFGKDSTERTDWHNVTAWGDWVPSELLLKGVAVCVTGSLRTDKYEKDGQARYKTYVNARTVVPCVTRARDHEATASAEHGEDSIPF